MRKIFFILFTGLYFFSQAQTPIQLSESALNFGDVFENAPDSLPLTITNNGSEPLEIEEIRFYKTYADYPFSTQDSTFSIAPNDSFTMHVHFAPIHNINHHSSLVIFTNHDRGPIYISLEGQGKYSRSYYNSTENKSEEALKAALKTRLAQGYTQFSYNAARDAMYMTIDNQKTNGQGASQNTLEGVYTGFTVVGYTSRTDAQNQGFNTEHTFPQGFFNQNLPMRTDLFHLFPTQQNANTQRSNLPFGVVTGSVGWQMGGSKRGSSKFEPRDKQKGPVARAMFYFVIRYQDYANHLSSQEGILRQWHETFPPNDISRKRNDDIASLQKNRNPFIDYPQFIERISSIAGNSSAPEVFEVDLTEMEIDYDSIMTFTNALYQYTLVNNGNQPLELKNITLNDNSLSFVNISGNDTSILPGRGLPMIIQLNEGTEGSFLSSLDFETNVSGNEQVNIPITAELIGGDNVEDLWNHSFSVFPNPASEQIEFRSEEPILKGNIQLFDISGKLFFAEELNGTSLKIPVSSYHTGVYLLKLSTDTQSYYKRISIVR